MLFGTVISSSQVAILISTIQRSIHIFVAHRYDMQEAGVALDSAMKTLSAVQYSA